MIEKAARPIVIVKRRKSGHGGHHGGAWKVAYADFVTAMMAFFLVMWLVTSVNKEQRAAIFEYFKNPSMDAGHSTKAAKGINGPGGASTSLINLGGGMDAPKTALKKETGMSAGALPKPADVDEAQRLAAEAERKQLLSLLQDLRAAIDKSKTLRPFKDQLLLDITPEGLRIQIVDHQRGSGRFKSGCPGTRRTVRPLARISGCETRGPRRTGCQLCQNGAHGVQAHLFDDVRTARIAPRVVRNGPGTAPCRIAG